MAGEAKCYDTLCNLHSLLSLEGYEVTKVKFLGGMKVLIKFLFEKATAIFKANKSIWSRWFRWVDTYGERVIGSKELFGWKFQGSPSLLGINPILQLFSIILERFW